MAVQPASYPPPARSPVLPVSSRSLSCGGPPLASPGLGHLPGAPTGVGSAGRQCLDHVLWAASSGPRAGAANRGAWPPEAPPGAPAGRLSSLPWEWLRSGLGLGCCGWRQQQALRPSPGTALDRPWGPLPGTALSPAPRRPVTQNPMRHTVLPPACPSPAPEPLRPLPPLRSHELGPGPLETLIGGPLPPSCPALLWATSTPGQASAITSVWGSLGTT